MHITYPINALPRAIPLCLGVQSEYGARPVSIDVSAWVGRWPDIVVSIQAVRPGEDASYPAVDVTREGNVVTWTPNAYDTEIPGSGSVEIVGLADGVKIIRTGAATSITATLTSTSKVPEEPLAAWADSILKAGEQAKMDAGRAADAADDAQRHAGDALAAAESAASSAESSAAQATDAAEQANDAKASANTAQQHADAAAASAQAAAGSAADLDGAVKAAAASAQSAANYRTLAGYSANAASQSAKLATEAEQKALGSANTAVSNAMNAESSAYAASQSAQQANTSAATAASRAAEAAASATKSQTAADMASEEVTKAEAEAKAAEDAADRAEAGATAAEASAQASAEDAATAETAAIRAETALANIPDDYTALAEAVRLKAQAIVNEQSGAVVVLTDAEPDEALSVVSHIDAADGVTEVSLTRTGRNILDGLAFARNIAATVTNAVIDEDAKTIKYAASRVSGKVLFEGGFRENARYTAIVTPAATNTSTTPNMLFRHTNGESTAMGKVDTIPWVYTSSAPDGTVAYIQGRNSGGTTTLLYEQCGVFEGVLTADDFVPYEGVTLTVTLPETVTSGTFDWTTGVLTINEDGASRTVQLAPQQLDMLSGYNALWSSTGDTYVRYTADLKSYIDSRIAAIAAMALSN